MPSCYCLVPDASGTRVLLVSSLEGWTLPTVEHSDGWFAHEAVSVARQLSERLGIRLVALREVEEPGLHLCELLELGGSPLPDSIVQQDFRDGNVAVRGRDCLFYDWSDTVVSHPFFSACRFLEYVESGGGSPRRRGGRRLATAVRDERLLDAYLDAWAEYAPRDRLRAVFRQAQRLNPLYLAIRWHRELPYCEPGSPWWRIMLSSMTESLQELLKERASR